ncbi:MAG: heavy metal translocating P-type ATPase, partial [Bryobacterales bacterium]|nr:heavy metal translocating P-type ATPase [Bryobacterales bacterium]
MTGASLTKVSTASVCILAIGWHLSVRYWVPGLAGTADWPLIAVLVLGGLPFLVTLLRGALKGQFGSDLLAGISIVTSVVLGEYLPGTVILLMLSGGAALEDFATRRASSVLSALARRMPQTAHRRTATGMEDIPLQGVRLGDLLTIFPHENCPADGEVVEGHSTVDESFLTGEPYRISRSPGSDVLSGAVNGEGALTIRVRQLPENSRYAKIVRVMEDAELKRPQLRRLADRLGAWYTVVALLVAGVAWVLSGDPVRFLAVLVIATPCPLLLAVPVAIIPVAIISAISIAAARGIIIKDPSMLERISSCRTMIFDKTGTLTYGKPALTDIVCAPGVTEGEALRLAASMEQYSRHPLAAAILERAREAGLEFAPVTGAAERPGMGLTGQVGGKHIEITGRGKALQRYPDIAPLLPLLTAGMESILLINESFAAAFRFRDQPRQESRTFIGHLAPKHGVNRVVLLSGDRESEVTYLAERVGITEALFGKSPEEKVAIVRAEAKLAPTMFLGDGINDAPAMQAATVGIAFGEGSDVTAEAAS